MSGELCSQARDRITVVHSHGLRLAKLIHAGGKVDGYDLCKTVDLFEVPLDDLGDIEMLLRELAPRWDCAIVRGGIADLSRTRGVRRLLHADRETGEPASLIDTPRSWLPLDVDALPAPPGLDITDLLACAALAVAVLPIAFRHVTMVVQATGSHGVRPGIFLRLWCWLSRLTSGAELKRWFRGVPVDHSVFGACQLVYTGAPLFAPGVVDPLPERIAVRFGSDETVAVPDAALVRPPSPRPRPIPPQPGHGQASSYAATVLAQLAVHILAAPIGQRHHTVMLASRRLAELEAAGLLIPEESEALLVKAAKGAGIGDDGRDVSKEVAGILRWARRSCAIEPTNQGGEFDHATS